MPARFTAGDDGYSFFMHHFAPFVNLDVIQLSPLTVDGDGGPLFMSFRGLAIFQLYAYQSSCYGWPSLSF